MGPMNLQLRLAVVVLVAVVAAAGHSNPPRGSASVAFETRCGWFSNPTPANAWLYDREAEWTISVQGGHEAAGDWPEFKPSQWVRTNGNYGYGCACLEVSVNKATHEVLEIKSARPKALTQCRRDAALKRWNRRLQ
jgi:Protein of unknown function (DUF4087)